MDYDRDRVDEMVLALLFLTSSQDGSGTRAWKGIPWEIIDRLHKKGYIQAASMKEVSVLLTEEGARLSGELFKAWFSGGRQ